ncbi:hypothetical protein SELMODRAFT_420947 [Selaginella moellendorffii]|uniref:Uncharacterized protein n=1 Tax=Selaginella moellendorffii TaxID=88036 RepID=D8SDM8_SELML|nr:hypothetical protein SELMODRAFT_420947 [Selaginella moellendorffii]
MLLKPRRNFVKKSNSFNCDKASHLLRNFTKASCPQNKKLTKKFTALFLSAWETKEQADILREEIKDIAKDSQAVLLEALHPAASRWFSLGLASRISLVKPLFEDMPLVAPPEPAKSEYVGCMFVGVILNGSNSFIFKQTTWVFIAFENPGGWRNERDAVAVNVLQTARFQPGARARASIPDCVYTRVHPKVENFTAYNDSGLFGIHTSSEHKFVDGLVDIIGDEIIFVAEPGEGGCGHWSANSHLWLQEACKRIYERSP